MQEVWQLWEDFGLPLNLNDIIVNYSRDGWIKMVRFMISAFTGTNILEE